MKQWELDKIYEALDQLEAHAANTIGAETAKMIADKANKILRQEFEDTGKIESDGENGQE